MVLVQSLGEFADHFARPSFEMSTRSALCEIIRGARRGVTLVVFMCMLTSSVVWADEKETLPLGAFVSQKSALDFTGYLVAADLAIDTINNDSSLRYFLKYTYNDSMCKASVSLRSFIDQVFLPSTENQIMLIGPDCSSATESVAEIAPSWNLVQISAASTSPLLSDTERFPLFLRTVSSDAEAAVGVKAAMKQFGWSKMAIITESQNIFSFAATRFRAELSRAKLKITKEFTFNTVDDIPGVVEDLMNSPARIIFINMYEHNAAEVICLAAKFGMHHPNYQWMFYHWYTDGWWTRANNCTVDNSVLQKFLKRSLTYNHYPSLAENDKDKLNVGNMSWNYFKSYYDSKIEQYKISNDSQLLGIHDSAFMFDAVWTAALAINSTASKLPSGVTFKNFTYDDKLSTDISKLLYEEAKKVNFFGLTGDVFYLENGDRPGRISMYQYRDDNNSSSLTKVQYARVVNGSLVFEEGESTSTLFPDGTPQDEEYVHISLILFIIYIVLSLIGIFFAVICLIFNLWFRDQKLMKLTSPYVSAMIIAGAVIFYITVIVFGVDENVASFSTVDHLCQTRIWLAAIGFSLLFGTVFAKSFRIYYIFNFSKPNSKFEVKDKYLFAIVGILIMVDVVILIPSTVISSAVLRREDEEIEGDNDDDLPQIIRVCTSDGSVVWLPILFCYKGFVLLFGLFLAFETRKVKYAALNESRFIAMSVYGAVIVSIALTPIGFLLNHFPTAQYAVLGIMLLFSMSLILALVFVSKMYTVYRDPQGTRSLRSGKTVRNPRNLSVVSIAEDEFKTKIVTLNSEIKALNEEVELLKSGLYSIKETDDDVVISNQNNEELPQSKAV